MSSQVPAADGGAAPVLPAGTKPTPWTPASTRRSDIDVPEGRRVRSIGRERDLTTLAEVRFIAQRLDEALRREVTAVDVRCAEVSTATITGVQRELVEIRKHTADALDGVLGLIESRTFRGRWRRFVRWIRRARG